ncbi:MAG: SAM-dependent methyltransferase [Lachnospiraceae bacterium]|nr:SAM-dependent methyltransferase [Lachnospiraceae bacterium]
MAIAAMVEEGSLLADIGTDHGYLPIWLLEEKRIPSAIAVDVQKGPLLRAKSHVEERGLSSLVDLRLGDGLSVLSPGEADAAVLAGMGGPLMARILKEGQKTAETFRYLVLSPQSDLFSFRHYLLTNGYRILDEDMVFDEGKYYTVIKAAPSRQGRGEEKGERPWDYIEKAYGRYLLQSGKPVVLRFLKKEKEKYEAIKEGLFLAKGGRAEERLSQVERELLALEKAIATAKVAEDKDGQ